ncbi:MAG: PHP domain protein [Methanoregula sp. PtaU1.Bin006]|uniref:PHP domain-containing protein n=1 Tax=Methanoregula sp. PtaU1.Bin006 TaxID=1811681 RepID=UPI0009D30689|nr:PHP domain-containing protein [Methanoregula sp. PtaU1.Bin006]OPY37227.1 MAG: PHP domain protein [Methanoregula sp. PtaU1.Bin006]
MKSIKNQYRGLIHIHTIHSFDGTLPIADFAALAKSKGYAFVILTEHAEKFDDTKMKVLFDECLRASDDSFLVIPGLEFNIHDEVHILGLGISTYIDEKDPDALIRKIHENNGVAILAHTAEYRKAIPYARLKDVDIIEIWNPRYGEIFSPSRKSIKILQEFRKMKTPYYASGGLDLHTIRDFVPLHQIVYSERLTPEEIIGSIKDGAFISTNGFVKIPAFREPSCSMTGLIYLLAFIQFIPNVLKKAIKMINKKVKRNQIMVF